MSIIGELYDEKLYNLKKEIEDNTEIHELSSCPEDIITCIPIWKLNQILTKLGLKR